MKKKFLSLALACMLMPSANICNALADGSETETVTYNGITYRIHSAYAEVTRFDNSVEDVEIPLVVDGCPVTEIAGYAFQECSNIKSVFIPSGVKKMGTHAFENCHNLTYVSIENGLTEIPDNAFCYCFSLNDINIPESVKKIGADAFRSSSLSVVDIPANVEEIASGAFGWCQELSAIAVKNPRCNIYSNAFFNNYEMQQYIYTGSVIGHENSTAQAYADEYGYTFEIISGSGQIPLGNVNNDDKIDASDASLILSEYSAVATGNISVLSEEQRVAADINSDGIVDSNDASIILAYYAYSSTGGFKSISQWLKSQ